MKTSQRKGRRPAKNWTAPPRAAPSPPARHHVRARRGAMSARSRRAGLHEPDAVLLRLGLAFVFAYAAVASLVDPSEFERYIPSLIPHELVEPWCMRAFSVFELVLAVALVLGWRVFAASALAAATLVTITAANPRHFDVLFRNVAITCAALALAARSRTPDAAESVIVLPD